MPAIKTNIEFIPFNEELALYFSKLNTDWLAKFFTVEPIDQQMLGNPKQFFIDKGGFIFFAKLNEDIVGTFALLKESDSVYELSKMAVSEECQGMKIGNTMMEYCIAKAKELNIGKIILYSNTKLEPAIHLYRKYGFIEVPLTSSVYSRANIKMELVIR